MKSILVLSFVFVALFAEAQEASILCDEFFQDHISFSKQLKHRNTSEITLVTWNAHKLEDKNLIPDLKRLSESSDIIFIQEAMHSTKLQNTFSSLFPFSFSFHKSFCTSNKQATGVMSAARFELQNSLTIVSPDTEPLTFTPKVSSYSQLMINNQIVHLINTHALNFNTGSSFERQMDQLAGFISQLSGPVIWAGDFNTWSPGRKNYLNKIAQSLQLEHLKPEKDPRYLILDHIYIRGMTALKTEVLPEKSSDHAPLRATLKLN
jgi:endonuclease/exonuclease/phosphatase (EEP) superfamily protein YafD